MRIATLMIALAALAGCAATPPARNAQPPERELSGSCDAREVQNHLGHRASTQAGAELLRLSGARVLRWVPPRTAVTMDYSPDRLTVSYDDNYVIGSIVCG